MELSQLNAFAVTAELKNMTKAADRLNLSLSALSTQIKSLESELEIPLFNRMARGVELTPEGAQLLEYALTVTDATESMKRHAMRMQKELKGSITIGVNTDPVFLRITDINTALLHRLPDVSLRFAISESGKTAEMLKKRELDIGFVYTRLNDSEVHSEKIVQVNICMVVSKGLLKDPQNTSWADLSKLPMVSGSSDCPFQWVLNTQSEEYKQPTKTVVATDEYVMMELVKNGMGLCIMREDNARKLEREGHVDVLEDKTISIPLCLAVLRSRKEEPLISTALEAVYSVFGVEYD